MDKAIELVADLNTDWYNSTGDEEWQPFEYRSCGAGYAVMFCGWPLFQSGADYLDDEAGQTLKEFIMPGIKEMLKNFSIFNGD